MAFQKRESEDYQKRMSEWGGRLSEVMLDIPLEEDVVRYMGQNTRERLIKLGKLAEQIERTT